MAEGTDEAAAAFQADITPGTKPEPARAPDGRFESLKPPVDRMFEPRDVEGDDDGGDDPAIRAKDPKDGRKRLPAGDEELDEGEPDEGDPDEEESDEEGSDDEASGDSEEGPKYEVTVDGETKEVSLKEALQGYIRTDTFHKRLNKISEIAQGVQTESVKNQQIRDFWIDRAKALEADYESLIPKEPDWDAEFAANPAAAHALKKQFDAVKNKLADSRQERMKQEQQRVEENKYRIAQFAQQGRQKFIEDNKLEDPKVLDKEIQSMRKTALSHGFTEQEVAEVYDPRMLSILRKASKYDRIMAAKPRAVIPGKGKTLAPGSVNGKSVRSDRKEIDGAQRKLAASGRVADAEDFFRTILK